MHRKYEYKVTILEHHLDTFGHVNNATYLQLYEEARWDFIHANGYGLKEVQESGIGPVILEINLKFKRELVNRDEITIVSQHQRLERDKFMIMKQEMVRADGAVCSEIELKFCLFDLKSRRMIPPTDAWLKAIGEDSHS